MFAKFGPLPAVESDVNAYVEDLRQQAEVRISLANGQTKATYYRHANSPGFKEENKYDLESIKRERNLTKTILGRTYTFIKRINDVQFNKISKDFI